MTIHRLNCAPNGDRIWDYAQRVTDGIYSAPRGDGWELLESMPALMDMANEWADGRPEMADMGDDDFKAMFRAMTADEARDLLESNFDVGARMAERWRDDASRQPAENWAGLGRIGG